MNPATLLPWVAPCLRQVQAIACHVTSLVLAAGMCIATLLLLGACTVCQSIVHNAADLDDYTIFANRVIAAPAAASPLRRLARTPAFVGRLRVPGEHGGFQALEQFLEETRTAALVVMREDRIVYEHYARGYDEYSMFNSFSIAKSIVGTLVGIAYSEGAVMSLDATVADYRPELATTAYGNVTLSRLLSMTSGVDDPPSVLPGRAQYYYGDDLHATIAHARTRGDTSWRYSEADAQVLGFVLAAATGTNVSTYLARKLWEPLGMEAPALWSLDREGGMEKAFCCISARARDFARFGLLYLNGGRWNGEQIVPEEWVARSVVPGVKVPDSYTHRHLWWHPPGEPGDYYAYGHNGQYLYVNPATRTVIVKFSETTRQDPLEMFRVVSRALAVP